MPVLEISIPMQIADAMAKEIEANSQLAESLKTVEVVANVGCKSLELSTTDGTVTRTFLPDYSEDDPPGFRVTLSPLSVVQTRLTRIHMQETYPIQMFVHEKVDVGEAGVSTIPNGDPVLGMAEQIKLWFERNGQFSAMVGKPTAEDVDTACICARWMNCQWEPVWTMEAADQYHVIHTRMLHNWMTIRKLEGAC